MKNAIVSCAGTNGIRKNIGDHVQSIAANQFMRTSVMVDREHLDTYSGEPVKVIMNGWFMHHPERFPPAEAIHPLFVSFHLRPKIGKRFLTEATIAYLKAHGPIGCRDKQTMRTLQACGIDAYFSACLTLTLGRTFPRAPKSEQRGVCFVDPLRVFDGLEVWKGLPRIVRHPLMTMRLYRKLAKQALKGERLAVRIWSFFALGAFLKAYRALFSDELLLSAEYYTHAVAEKDCATIEEQFDMARRLLDRYAHAKYCVTSRIHCALPCIGMGVPVIYIDSESKRVGKGRYGGLSGFFNRAKITGGRLSPQFKLIGGKRPHGIGEDAPVPATTRHREAARVLAERCEAFAAE